MKIVKYRLQEDGSIPTYIVNGGFFPVVDSAPGPQEAIMLGVATDDAPGEVLSTKAKLTQYLQSVGSDWLQKPSGENTELVPFDASAASTFLWSLKTA